MESVLFGFYRWNTYGFTDFTGGFTSGIQGEAFVDLRCLVGTLFLISEQKCVPSELTADQLRAARASDGADMLTGSVLDVQQQGRQWHQPSRAARKRAFR